MTNRIHKQKHNKYRNPLQQNTETLGIPHGLKKFHHYCFADEVCMGSDHEPPVSTFKKCVASLSHRLQRILLRIHQYKNAIQVWATVIHHRVASKQKCETKNRKRNTRHVHYHQCNSHAQTCQTTMRAKEIAIPDDKHTCMLSECILHDWPLTKAEMQKYLQPYWSFRNDITIIDYIAIKGIRIIIHATL